MFPFQGSSSRLPRKPSLNAKSLFPAMFRVQNPVVEVTPRPLLTSTWVEIHPGIAALRWKHSGRSFWFCGVELVDGEHTCVCGRCQPRRRYLYALNQELSGSWMATPHVTDQDMRHVLVGLVLRRDHEPHDLLNRLLCIHWPGKLSRRLPHYPCAWRARRNLMLPGTETTNAGRNILSKCAR
jgi:hypothetical protein